MDNKIIRRVIILGAIAVIAIVSIQVYWIKRTLDIKQKEFQQTVFIALHNVAQDLSKFNNQDLPTQGLINQISSDYFVVNINGVIDPSALEYYLRKNLEAASMKENYEYGIYDCTSDEMVYGSYVTYDPSIKESASIKMDLPVYNESPYYFGVRFPKRISKMMGGLNYVIFISILLFVTIAFFVYSMSVILRQKRLSEMQRDFINNMTHEFKTPISSIGVSADVFLQAPEIKNNPRLLQYANIVKSQNKRMNKHVEKVLQIARFDNSESTFSKESINIHDVIQEIIDIHKLKANNNTVFNLDLGSKTENVNADKFHFTNVIQNIVDNALKYGKETSEINIKTEEQKGLLSIQIEDNGIGIKKEHLSKLFNKFYRVPTGNVHNVKGFGLGLFYCYEVCKAHKWDIKIESKEGIGTTVSISIPLKK